MSLITRCPACATTFKVVPDQLRISDGWVRCGQCTEVFDATANLVEEGDPSAGAGLLASGAQTHSRSPRPEPPAFLRAAAHVSPAPVTPAPVLRAAPLSAPAQAPAQAPVPASPGLAASPALAPPAPSPRPSREPVMPELVMPDLVLPAPPPPVRVSPPEPAAAAAEPAVPRSADELLAEQLARLDLDLATPEARRQVEPTLDEDDLGLELGDVFVPRFDPDEPHAQLDALPAVEPEPAPAEPRARPQGDRFPVLSVPELDLPGTPRPPRTDPPGVTLAALRFPDDPAPAHAPGPEVPPLAAPKTEPVPHGPAEPALADEVSPSLLSESAAVDAPGDLSTQWAAETPAQPRVAAPVRRAEDEVDAFGPDVLKGLQFLRRARREAFWRRPLVRGGLSLVALLLSALLLGQWAVHERARLVAAEPALRPALQALCDVVGCELSPLRRIESFVIESSAFNKTHGEGFQLALAIRNTGALPLSMPAAELSLTDSQDQAVLRRVFLPAELGAPPTLGPGAEWSAALPVRVAGAASLRIAGYRVLVFYP